MGNAEKPKTSEQKREYQKGYDQRTGYAAQRKYKQEHGKSFTFVVYSPQENDILEQLLSQTNKAGYIKGLIREDIEKRKIR